MAIATTTTLADLINEEIGRCLEAPRTKPVWWMGGILYKMLRVRDLTGEGFGSSDFNKYGTLTAYDVAEGELFNEVQSLTPTSVNVVPTEKQVISWITNRAMRALAAPNAARTRAADEAAEHTRAHIDKFDKAVFALAPNLTLGANKTKAALTVSDVRLSVKTMSAANAPQPWIGFLSTQQWDDLCLESGSALADAAKSGTVGEELWQNYQIKHFLSVDWVVSNNVYDDGTDAYGGIISDRALGAVFQLLPQVETIANTSAEAVKRRSTMISSVADWGVGVVESDMGVYLRSRKTA
ncbi:MAG TPA: hypothetical protein PLF11_00135 [Bacillota bacterium]|nr:hypothetical protein [Dermatophilaceae bacterium]HOI35766.1 hypothetical protein [Bacillota bacterium]